MSERVARASQMNTLDRRDEFANDTDGGFDQGSDDVLFQRSPRPGASDRTRSNRPGWRRAQRRPGSADGFRTLTPSPGTPRMQLDVRSAAQLSGTQRRGRRSLRIEARRNTPGNARRHPVSVEFDLVRQLSAHSSFLDELAKLWLDPARRRSDSMRLNPTDHSGAPISCFQIAVEFFLRWVACLSPRATILSAPSGSGRYKASACLVDAVGHVSTRRISASYRRPFLFCDPHGVLRDFAPRMKLNTG